jgi:hypothetical protein
MKMMLIRRALRKGGAESGRAMGEMISEKLDSRFHWMKKGHEREVCSEVDEMWLPVKEALRERTDEADNT